MMMKVVAIVLCMSVLVASQDMLGGDGLRGLMTLNMLAGRSPFHFNLFGGPPAQAQTQAQATGQTGARGARTSQRTGSASPFGGLTGLLVLDFI